MIENESSLRPGNHSSLDPPSSQKVTCDHKKIEMIVPTSQDCCKFRERICAKHVYQLGSEKAFNMCFLVSDRMRTRSSDLESALSGCREAQAHRKLITKHQPSQECSPGPKLWSTQRGCMYLCLGSSDSQAQCMTPSSSWVLSFD